jgi:hypothetical protein
MTSVMNFTLLSYNIINFGFLFCMLFKNPVSSAKLFMLCEMIIENVPEGMGKVAVWSTSRYYHGIHLEELRKP